MEINLRQAIVQRVAGKDKDELTGIIQDSVGGVEMALPGLGVLFEMIWSDSPEELKSQLVDQLHRHLEAMPH